MVNMIKNGGNEMKNRTWHLQFWTNRKEQVTINATIEKAIEKARRLSAEHNTDVRVFSNFHFLANVANVVLNSR